MADLRPITESDAEVLAAIHVQAFDRSWTADEFAGLIRTGAAGWMTPNGFILTRTAAGEAEVLTIAVTPTARRLGLGRALVAAPVAAETVFLEVAADNYAAIALYHQAGFEQAGTRRGYYGRPGGAVDALVLRKTTEPGA
jgi:ribosomal-protein-alanine N-acetyltransferase